MKKGQAKLNRVSRERLSAQGRKLWVWFAKSSCNTLKGFFGVGLHADSSIRENARTIMARIVAEKSESSFSQVIHSAGVRRFGEAQLPRTENIDQSTEEMSERHDHSRNYIGKVRIELCAKSFILQVYDVLAISPSFEAFVKMNRPYIVDAKGRTYSSISVPDEMREPILLPAAT